MTLATRMGSRIAKRRRMLEAANIPPGQRKLMLAFDKAQAQFLKSDGGTGDLLLSILLAQVLDALRACPAGEPRKKLAAWCAGRIQEIGETTQDDQAEAVTDEVTVLASADSAGTAH